MGFRAGTWAQDSDGSDRTLGRHRDPVSPILLNTYDGALAGEPLDFHWMAVRITHLGGVLVVINVYAPPDKVDREDLYEFLR